MSVFNLEQDLQKCIILCDVRIINAPPVYLLKFDQGMLSKTGSHELAKRGWRIYPRVR